MVISNSNTQEVNPVLGKPKRLEKWRIVASRLKRRILSHVWSVRITLILFLLVFVFFLFLLIINIISKSRVGYYIALGSDFIFTPPDKIQEIDGKVNLLILGKGGLNHQGPDLTDTMIFVSINPKDNSIITISLPRDIWIPELRAKLNSTYYWGNQKKPGGGLALTKSKVESITGQTVQYGAVIDFEGFKQIIDTLGGISVNVENSFVDEKYPIAGRENDNCGGDPELKCRYEIISFEKGRQTMNGETALKFIRSRNAVGDEGTDFARAARQEKVITAIKEKILSTKVLLSPKKLLQIKKIVMEHVETDINPEAAAILARYLFSARGNIKTNVLSEDFLINPPKSEKYDNLYVFIPKDGNPSTGSGQDWDKVHEWVKEILN